MKNSNSLVEELVALRRKRFPTNGMLPSSGTCCSVRVLVVWMTPPKKTVPPLDTSTCVVACWVSSAGMPLMRAIP